MSLRQRQLKKSTKNVFTFPQFQNFHCFVSISRAHTIFLLNLFSAIRLVSGKNCERHQRTRSAISGLHDTRMETLINKIKGAVRSFRSFRSVAFFFIYLFFLVFCRETKRCSFCLLGRRNWIYRLCWAQTFVCALLFVCVRYVQSNSFRSLVVSGASEIERRQRKEFSECN